MTDIVVMPGSAIPTPNGPRCAVCTKPVRLPPQIRGAKGDLDANDYCSAGCFEEARKGISQGALRKALFARDGGVCQAVTPSGEKCGNDCEAIRRELDALLSSKTSATYARVHFYVRLGFPRAALETRGKSLWEAAHLTARVEGGSTRIENAATFCLVHHREDTTRLAHKRRVRR